MYLALIEAYQNEGVDVFQKCECIVNALSDICTTASQGSREVALVALGAIGR